jgi:hypothetical protein
MPTSPLLDFYPWSCGFSLTRRTAVCGPACTVEWEGRTGNRLPYPDCARSLLRGNSARFSSAFVLRFVIATSPNLNWIPPNTRRGPVCICPCHIGGAAIHGVRCCEQGPGRLATMLTESIQEHPYPKKCCFCYFLSIFGCCGNCGSEILPCRFLETGSSSAKLYWLLLVGE